LDKRQGMREVDALEPYWLLLGYCTRNMVEYLKIVNFWIKFSKNSKKFGNFWIKFWKFQEFVNF
jgi:hypothetical protein